MDLDFIRHRITQLRLSRQMSEYQLSLELGQCKSYIQGITSGKSLPSVKQLYNICDFFGITLSQFFDENNNSSQLYYQTVNAMQDLDESELEPIFMVVTRVVQLKFENNQLKGVNCKENPS